MLFPLDVRAPLEAGDDLRPETSTFGAGLPVVLDDADGAVRDLAATRLAVGHMSDGDLRRAFSSRRRPDALVTDSRVVFSSGRRGTRLVVGHVRYDWLVAVGGREGGPFRGNELRLDLQHASGEYAVVTLSFDRSIDVHEVAQDIIRRAALHWLTLRGGDVTTPAWQAESWQPLLQAPKAVAPRGEFAMHLAPSYERVAAAPLWHPFAATT